MATERPRALIVAGVGTVMLFLLAGVAVGLRRAASSKPRSGAATPLVPGRFDRPPALGLGLLQQTAPPAGMGRRWISATADGKIEVGELRGTPVVLNFWASWCDPCRREAPALADAWRREGGSVLFLGVNQRDRRGDAVRFVRRYGVGYPSLRERGNAASVRWRVPGYPVTYFISARGRVVAEAIGQIGAPQLARGIAAARRGRL